MDCSTVIIKQSEKNIWYTDTDRGIVDFSTVIITAQASAAKDPESDSKTNSGSRVGRQRKAKKIFDL